MYCYEWNEHRQNTRISRVQATTPFQFRSSANKDEQDLPVRKKSNASEGFNSERRLQLRLEARKRREQSRRGLKKQNRKQRRDSKLNGSEVPVDVSVHVKQLNKGLAGCWIKAKVMLL